MMLAWPNSCQRARILSSLSDDLSKFYTALYCVVSCPSLTAWQLWPNFSFSVRKSNLLFIRFDFLNTPRKILGKNDSFGMPAFATFAGVAALLDIVFLHPCGRLYRSPSQ